MTRYTAIFRTRSATEADNIETRSEEFLPHVHTERLKQPERPEVQTKQEADRHLRERETPAEQAATQLTNLQ